MASFRGLSYSTAAVHPAAAGAPALQSLRTVLRGFVPSFLATLAAGLLLTGGRRPLGFSHCDTAPRHRVAQCNATVLRKLSDGVSCVTPVTCAPKGHLVFISCVTLVTCDPKAHLIFISSVLCCLQPASPNWLN